MIVGSAAGGFAGAIVLYETALGVGIACGPLLGAALVVCVIVAGAMIGVNNTLTTQAVMLVAPVERPVASAAYGFIRFIGGGLAPYAAGLLAERFNIHVPFWIGAAAVAAAIAVLATGHRLLADADVRLADGTAAHAGEADLDADELEEIREDATGEAGVLERAEVGPGASHEPR